MNTPLASRERVVARLRELTMRDDFMKSYALLLACEMLDLRQVNQLLDDVDDVHRDPDLERALKAREIAAERWHPSRLS